MTTTTKILLDTDIGNDIDDALCLAYLLAQPQCELLGITTVTGESKRRAMMASAQCKLAGKQIPIIPGIEKPLLIPPHQTHAAQAHALKNWPHATRFPATNVIDFMRSIIRTYPGEVTLLGIGPLTNIALLFAVDPEIPGLLKSLVLMCGQFMPAGREWNALNDPHATAMVYNASVAQHRSIGLDVTMRVQMEAEEFKAHCTHPFLQPVLDFADIWFQQSNIVTFHDPLAAATIFDDEICTFGTGIVSVELNDEKHAGQTYWHVEQNVMQTPVHEVAVAVQPEIFFEHYFGIF